MICAWEELLCALPGWLRKEVDPLDSKTLLEIRLRINSPPELVFQDEYTWLKRDVTKEDFHYIVNAATQYSPWAAASVAQGYLTIAGGHRIGICGEAIVQQGRITGIKNITSLCIRVARDLPGIAEKASGITGSVLILGPPGWGKTTFLRDLIRQLERTERISVLDERRELFPPGLPHGKRVDVLSGCSKREGILMLMRTMGPSCIAVDEITDQEDAFSLLQAANCGVRLLATAHAMSVSEFRQRAIYRPLWENQVFDVMIVLQRDRSYIVERMMQWVTNGSVRY